MTFKKQYFLILISIISFYSSYPCCAQQDFIPYFEPDLPLIAATQDELLALETINARLSDLLLGSEPSDDFLDEVFATAKQDYQNLGISISDGMINGGDELSAKMQDPKNIIKKCAQYLKFYPEGDDVETAKLMASNVIWLVAQKYIDGDWPFDKRLYDYDAYARASLFHEFHLSDDIKAKFGKTLDDHSRQFTNVWPNPIDGSDYYTGKEYSTDWIYGISDILVGYGAWMKTDDEKVRWMKAMVRYFERFFTISEALGNGIKSDGSGFHHWAAYQNYMYAYKTAARAVFSLCYQTPFDISAEKYLNFRDALFYQLMLSNDDGVIPLAACGRKPANRIASSYSEESLVQMALVGGEILGIDHADPVLAGYVNRRWGINSEFNYSSASTFTNGFFQMNYGHMGIFRKDNWIASFKGLSDYMWGAEIYPTSNRFGRYQSYGALEIIYNGSLKSINGYDHDTWNWNYNPGTTSIVLPFDKLHAEMDRIDESQSKSFVGSLAFNNQNSEVLTPTHGVFGMFAMDFKGKEGQGFSTRRNPESHNATFVFKKSTFAFSDMIVALGSGIGNNDSNYPTVTTLYQRLKNTNKVVVNGSSQGDAHSEVFSDNEFNWVLDNSNTGYFVVNGGDLKIWSGSEATPNHNEIVVPGSRSWQGNATLPNTYAYIDHGTNPNNGGYEYVCLPATSSASMTSLATKMENDRPYLVEQKDSKAHIVKHIKDKTVGFAFFDVNSELLSLNSIIKSNSHPCLVMHQEINPEKYLLSMTYPDLGFEWRQVQGSSPIVTINLTLYGEWGISSHPSATILESNNLETVVRFDTVDGLPIEIELTRIGDAPLRELIASAPIDLEDKNAIATYPNPVVRGNPLKVEYDRNFFGKGAQIVITDLSGKVVLRANTLTYFYDNIIQLETSHMPVGLCFLILIGKDKSLTKKIMVSDQY
ncbi:MAG: hypothetical protein JXQ96_01140 [Cyclobacteriaceae bacterium]